MHFALRSQSFFHLDFNLRSASSIFSGATAGFASSQVKVKAADVMEVGVAWRGQGRHLAQPHDCHSPAPKMASIYGWVPLLAALVLSLVFENGVHGQNTTQCRDFALNIVCTSEHRSPPDCTPARNPLVACAEEKDNLCRYICPSLVPLAAAFLKSTYDTVKTTCSDHEISSGFTKSPECWPHAAMCAISLNALPEGGNIDCRRFMPKLVQCQKNATESCASLQTKLLKTTLAQNPCYSESAFQASSAHFPVGLPSVSLFAILIILLVL